MTSSMNQLLRALRGRTKASKGFTIVELLIVIVVIAILAAIVLVSYNGLTNRASESAIKSDLRTAGKKLQVYETSNGFYPNSHTTAGVPNPSNQGTTLRYSGQGSKYCLIHDYAGKIFSVSSNQDVVEGYCQAGILSTYAGSNSERGYVDGVGANARFRNPASGTLTAHGGYITDSGNNRIRRLIPNDPNPPTISTFAGSGVAGSQDGTGLAAQFNDPGAIVSDAAGNLYVADSGNLKIRKISPAGIVTTLAGSGAFGYNDGPGVSATFTEFGRGSTMAVDKNSNVYVVDNGARIRKITPAGVVSTLSFDTPIHNPIEVMTIDHNDNLIIGGDYGLKKVTTDGQVTVITTKTYAGSEAAEGIPIVNFGILTAIAADRFGNIYISEVGTYTYPSLIKVTPDGKTVLLAGGTVGGYDSMQSIVVDLSGRLFLLDGYASMRMLQ